MQKHSGGVNLRLITTSQHNINLWREDHAYSQGSADVPVLSFQPIYLRHIRTNVQYTLQDYIIIGNVRRWHDVIDELHLVSTLGQSSPSENSSSVSYGLDSGFWYTLLLAIVGDVNGDGNVDLKDVIAALQLVTGQSPADIYEEADADGDGKIRLGEAIMVLNKLGGLP